MVTKSIFENIYFWCMFRAGWKARSVISTAVYRKSLRLTASARQARTLGEIVNLMQLDSAKIEGLINMNFHVLWDGVYQICGYVIILVRCEVWLGFVFSGAVSYASYRYVGLAVARPADTCGSTSFLWF
jgi:ABC-type multidrug transport system fused ATPase/permease subunit